MAWYSILKDYDPKNYKSLFDTSKLVGVNGSGQIVSPWISKVTGNDKNRYQPTLGFGKLGKGGPHYNYTLGVEGLPYYDFFGSKLIDSSGHFTELGKKWALAVDSNIPTNSPAGFFNEDGSEKSSWTLTSKDAHNRNPKSFNSLTSYVNHIRKDKTLGSRHNVFLNKGKRYFYKDDLGNEHWISPEDASKYTISDSPIRSSWSDDNTTYWEDYEITAPKENTAPIVPAPNPALGGYYLQPIDDLTPDSPLRFTKPTKIKATPTEETEEGSKIGAKQFEGKKPFNLDVLRRFTPGLLSLGDFINTLLTNKRVYDEELKGIKPNLQLDDQLHRQIVGDEGTKQAYYQKAALGQSKAAKPFTSDADRYVAYLMEAKRIGDELRSKGDLADNLRIRETSDESLKLQHLNQQLRTLVANANTTEINKANAAIHDLLALKYSALGTSYSNWLKGLLANMLRGNAERNAYKQQLAELDYALEINTDTLLARLLSDYLKAVNDWTENPNSENAEKKRLALKALYQKKLELLRKHLKKTSPTFTTILGSKKGGKLDYDSELLYKVTKDAVKHFREVSKMASDARIATLPKSLKLTPKKMLYGGRAPFMVYTPLAVGGGDGTAATATTLERGSGKKDEKDKTLDVIQDLFKTVAGKGLPIDVNKAYTQLSSALALAKEGVLDNEDLSSIYLNSLKLVNDLQYSKEKFTKAYEHANSNNSLEEYAVTSDGKIVVLDTKSGKIESMKLNDYLNSENKNPLTNGQLLTFRENHYLDNSLLDVVAQSVSIDSVSDYIRKNLSSLGTDREFRESYILDDVMKGLEVIKNNNGIYKTSNLTETQLRLAAAALSYIYKTLPNNMKTVLSLYGDPKELISSMIAQKTGITTEIKLDAVSGKSTGAKEGTSAGNSEGLKLDAATALVSGKGYRESMDFNPGTSYAVTVNGIHTEFLKHSGENMGQITMDLALLSTLKGVLDFNKATLGGSKLNPVAYNHILINNGEVIGVDLPVEQDKNTPDFTMLKKLQTLDQELLKKGILDSPENWEQVNLVCLSLGIPLKYINGKLNTYNWNRFAAFLVITDDSALLDKNVLLEDIIKQADSSTRDLYEQFLQSKSETKDYDLGSGIFGIGKQALYQGTVFVPVKSNYVGAALSGGQNITMSLATELELKEQGYDKQKIKSYTKQYKLVDLND